MNRSLRILSSTHIKRLLGIGGVVLASSLATFLAVRARAAGIPAANALTYTGYLETPDGQPITDEVDVAVSVWDALKDGNSVCDAKPQKVKPSAGRFQLALPNCAAAVGANADLWLEATVNGTSLGRTKLGAVPYAVEANHASAADAATDGSPLATQLAALQADVDATKARLDGALTPKLAKFSPTKFNLNQAAYTWVTGTDAAKLPAGRYWTFNTGRAWAIATPSCTTACESSIVTVAPCMKLGDTLTMADAEVLFEPPLGAASLAFSTTDFFDLDKETANVQFGLCAKRQAVGTSLDANLANMYSVVMTQPK